MLAECIALGLFLAGLGLCIVTGIQILYALLFGLLCFSIYVWPKDIRQGKPAPCCGRVFPRYGISLLFLYLSEA